MEASIIAQYIHFSDEQKHRANSVDLPEFLRHKGEKLIQSGRDKRLSSDHSITVRGNQWFDHASEQGGLAIDFVQQFYGLSFPEAVTMLLGGESGVTYLRAQPEPMQERKPFALPPAHTDMRRVYAYLLQHRHIDREVLTAFAREKFVYESAEPSADKRRYIITPCSLGWTNTAFHVTVISGASTQRAKAIAAILRAAIFGSAFIG